MLNNAGYTLVGTAEEASVTNVHELFETNYFGMLHVIRAAALPDLALGLRFFNATSVSITGSPGGYRHPGAAPPPPTFLSADSNLR